MRGQSWFYCKTQISIIVQALLDELDSTLDTPMKMLYCRFVLCNMWLRNQQVIHSFGYIHRLGQAWARYSFMECLRSVQLQLGLCVSHIVQASYASYKGELMTTLVSSHWGSHHRVHSTCSACWVCLMSGASSRESLLTCLPFWRIDCRSVVYRASALQLATGQESLVMHADLFKTIARQH